MPQDTHIFCPMCPPPFTAGSSWSFEPEPHSHSARTTSTMLAGTVSPAHRCCRLPHSLWLRQTPLLAAGCWLLAPAIGWLSSLFLEQERPWGEMAVSRVSSPVRAPSSSSGKGLYLPPESLSAPLEEGPVVWGSLPQAGPHGAQRPSAACRAPSPRHNSAAASHPQTAHCSPS